MAKHGMEGVDHLDYPDRSFISYYTCKNEWGSMSSLSILTNYTGKCPKSTRQVFWKKAYFCISLQKKINKLEEQR